MALQAIRGYKGVNGVQVWGGVYLALPAWVEPLGVEMLRAMVH